MIKGLKKIAFLIAVIFLMRMAVIRVINWSDHLLQVVEKDFDPSIIFYTESKDVLKAEKSIGRRIERIK